MRFSIDKANKLAKLGRLRYVTQYGVLYCGLIMFAPVLIVRLIQFRGINQYNLNDILISFLICMLVGFIIGMANWNIIINTQKEYDE